MALKEKFVIELCRQCAAPSDKRWAINRALLLLFFVHRVSCYLEIGIPICLQQRYECETTSCWGHIRDNILPCCAVCIIAWAMPSVWVKVWESACTGVLDGRSLRYLCVLCLRAEWNEIIEVKWFRFAARRLQSADSIDAKCSRILFSRIQIAL